MISSWYNWSSFLLHFLPSIALFFPSSIWNPFVSPLYFYVCFRSVLGVTCSWITWFIFEQIYILRSLNIIPCILFSFLPNSQQTPLPEHGYKTSSLPASTTNTLFRGPVRDAPQKYTRQHGARGKRNQVRRMRDGPLPRQAIVPCHDWWTNGLAELKPDFDRGSPGSNPQGMGNTDAGHEGFGWQERGSLWKW